MVRKQEASVAKETQCMNTEEVDLDSDSEEEEVTVVGAQQL
jgi:hypothetical protein